MSSIRNFHFSHPRQQALLMAITLGLFWLIAFLLLPQIWPVFTSNPYLNGLIIVVFIVGIIATFWQVWQISTSVRWINAYSRGNLNKVRGTPRLLAPLALMMKGDQLPTGMNTASAQSILDSIATRMDEARDITRYLINLLIFLGLLGTFYGLATTIPAVVDTIRALNINDSDTTTALGNLMGGLETQLGGMGTAFGSSLIGLTGSLMVGLLELFAGHGQNRFYREFEEWLSNFTSVGMAEKGLELNIDPHDDTPLARSFRSLSESLSRLDQRLSAQTDSTAQIEALFTQMQESIRDQTAATIDQRNALRVLEAQLVRMNEDLSVGRDSSTNELRRDLIAINQTLRHMIDLQD